MSDITASGIVEAAAKGMAFHSRFSYSQNAEDAQAYSDGYWSQWRDHILSALATLPVTIEQMASIPPDVLSWVSAHPEAAKGLAEGTVRVQPREPDKAMLNAARDWSVKKYGIGVGNDGATGCWQAMWDAASTPVPSDEAQGER